MKTTFPDLGITTIAKIQSPDWYENKNTYDAETEFDIEMVVSGQAIIVPGYLVAATSQAHQQNNIWPFRTIHSHRCFML